MNRTAPICNKLSEMDRNNDDTDEALMSAVARGDHTALRELFTRHAPWLAARLKRVTPADSVEDVLQETFIAVWRGARSYRAEGKFGAWLWGIAGRQAALWARKQGKTYTERETYGSDDPAASAARKVDLQQALATLGPAGSEQRELVRLVFLDDKPLVEVAAHFGIPVGTVKSRLYKVRQLLRGALQGTEEGRKTKGPEPEKEGRP
jgi:RNA polymerase sigma-70 factor (ECF subfamily)